MTYRVRYLDNLGMDRECYVSGTTERLIRQDAAKAGFQILHIKLFRHM